MMRHAFIFSFFLTLAAIAGTSASPGTPVVFAEKHESLIAAHEATIQRLEATVTELRATLDAVLDRLGSLTKGSASDAAGVVLTSKGDTRRLMAMSGGMTKIDSDQVSSSLVHAGVINVTTLHVTGTVFWKGVEWGPHEPSPVPTPAPSGGPFPAPTSVPRPVPTPSPTQCLTRYVYIRQEDYVLNLAEVEAYGPSNGKLSPVSAELRLTHPSFPASLCINGNTGDFCHGDGPVDWLEIDFGFPQKMSKIVVYNRPDCCQFRIVGAVVSINSGSQRTGDTCGVWTIPNTQSSYTLTA